MTDEFDPDRPGPPREVHEDAAARERSISPEVQAELDRITTPEVRGRQLLGSIADYMDERYLNPDSCQFIVTQIAAQIRDAERVAHAAEREACAEIAKSKMREVNEGAFRDPENVRRDKLEQGQVACAIEFAIRQRSEAPDE